MYQPSLFREKQNGIVNVSKIPQRSPFRYPGGKTWFMPCLRAWIYKFPKPSLFIEPFAGGGIASLTVGFEKMADHVIMVELDEQIAAVWKTILSDDAHWLINQIVDFDITVDNVNEIINYDPSNTKQLAFQTILKNRTSHGGIIAPGAGLIKNGEAGKGISSRWYANTLAKRIANIYKIRDRFTFIQGDGLVTMEEYASKENVAFFIDPPYTAGGKRAGSRLYKYFELDHQRLFDLCASLKGHFLMTYDIAEEVKELSRKYQFQFQEIPMKNTHHAEMKELIISKDLSF